MNDTTYIFGQNVDRYTPFENEEQVNYNGKFNNKFCPVCHYNLNSAMHRRMCENKMPVGGSIIPMLSLCCIYVIIKFIKTRNYGSINNCTNIDSINLHHKK